MNEDTPTELINHQAVTLEIPSVGLPTCPKELGRLYFSATVAEKMAEKIKGYVKDLMIGGGEVEGLFLRRGNNKKELTNLKGIFDAINEHTGGNVTANEFLRCCTLRMSALEQLFHIKSPEQRSIAESKKALQEVIEPFIRKSRGGPVVVFAKPENAQ